MLLGLKNLVLIVLMQGMVIFAGDEELELLFVESNSSAPSGREITPSGVMLVDTSIVKIGLKGLSQKVIMSG